MGGTERRSDGCSSFSVVGGESGEIRTMLALLKNFYLMLR